MLGASLLCPSNAFASVRMYALWYPSTNSGQGAAVANSGATIGGQFAVRVVVQPEQGEGTIVSASIIQQSIRELTDAHPVTSGQLAEFQRVDPNPQYGDPTSNVVVLESPFINLAGHNGTYQIDVTVSCVVTTNNPPPNDRRTIHPPPVSMTLTMNNLVLVDSRSEPYFVWKPLEVAPPPQPLNVPIEDPVLIGPTVPFSVQIQHAQSGVCTLRLEIFTSENNQTPILVKQFTNVPRPGVWQWEWDGKLADGSTAPRGVYSYRLSALAYVPTLPDTDSNRSNLLQIHCQDLGVISDDGSTAVYKITYILNSAENRNASSGNIVIFDHDEAKLHTRELSAGDLTPGTHEVIFNFASPQEAGRYIFLVCAQDNHRDMSKTHDTRWAVPHNQRRVLRACIAFSYSQFNNHSEYFCQQLRTMGYKRLPGFDWWYGNPNIGDMRRALEYMNAQGVKPLKVVLFSGHSHENYAGKALLMRGPVMLADSADPGSQNWLVTCYWDWQYAIPGLRGRQNSLIVESIGGMGATLTNLDLVILIGCSLNRGVGYWGLSDCFLYKGARTVVTVGYTQTVAQTVSLFLDGTDGPNNAWPGFLDRLKSTTVHSAWLGATEANREFLQMSFSQYILGRVFNSRFQGDQLLRLRP